MLAVCEREGLEAVTARRVAREMRCSPMALYRHFASMDDVVAEAWGAVHALLERTIWSEASRASTPVDELAGVFRGLVSFAESRPQLARLILSVPVEHHASRLGAQILASYERLCDLVRRGVAQGVFRPDLDPRGASLELAFLLIGIATLTISPRRDALAGCGPARLLDATVQEALSGLLPRA